MEQQAKNVPFKFILLKTTNALYILLGMMS